MKLSREQSLQLKRECDPHKRIDVLNSVASEIFRSQPSEASELIEEAYVIARKNNIHDEQQYARSLLVGASIDETRANYSEGLEKIEKALAIFRKDQNYAAMANAFNAGGVLYRSQSEHIKALEWYEEAIKLFQQVNDTERMAAVFNNIGAVYDTIGNYEEALTNYLKALDIYEELKNIRNVAIVKGNVGNIYYYLKDFERSKEYFNGALNIHERMNDSYSIGHVLLNLSSVYKWQGIDDHSLYEEALEILNRTVEIFREIGERRYEGDAIMKIGRIQERLNRKKTALRSYRKSAKILGRLDTSLLEYVEVLYSIGTLQHRLGEPDEAHQVLLKGLRAAQECRAKASESRFHKELASFYKDREDLEKAYHHLDRYQHISEELFNEESRAAIAKIQARFNVESARREVTFQQERAEYLKGIADQRSKELTGLAMRLVEKNNALTAIAEEVRSTFTLSEEERIRQLNIILERIENTLRSNDDWNRFEEVYQLVHHDFIQQLSNDYPKLSTTELKVCALLKINLSNKEIGNLLYVSGRTIESHRYRIRKKLGLDSDVNLGVYLSNL